MATPDPHIQPTTLRNNRTTRSPSVSNSSSVLANNNNNHPPTKSNIRSQPVFFNDDDSEFEEAFITYPPFNLQTIKKKITYPQHYIPRQIMLSLFISLKASNDIDLFGAAKPIITNLLLVDPTIALIQAVKGSYLPEKDMKAGDIHQGNFQSYITKHHSPEGYFRFGFFIKTMNIRIAAHIFHWFSTTEHIVHSSQLLSKNSVCIWFAFTDRLSINMENFKDFIASALPQDRIFDIFEKKVFITDVMGCRMESRALVFQCAEEMREENERDVLQIKFSGRYRHVVPMTIRNMSNRNAVAVRLLHTHMYLREHRDIIRVVPNSSITDVHEKNFDVLLTQQQGKTVPAARTIDTRGNFILISGYSALSKQNRLLLKTQVEKHQLDCDIYPPSTTTIISSSRDTINSLPVNNIETKSTPTTPTSTITSSTKTPLEYAKIIQKFAQPPPISQSTLDKALGKLESRNTAKLETITTKIDSLLSNEHLEQSDVETIVDTKISAYDERINNLEKEVAQLKTSHNDMLENNTKLNNKLDKLDNHMGSTSNQLALLSSQITAIITNPTPTPVPPQPYFPPHPNFPSPSPFMTPLLPYQMDPSFLPMNIPPPFPAPSTNTVHNRVTEVLQEQNTEQTSISYPSNPIYNSTPPSMSSKFTYVENPDVKELYLVPKQLTMSTPDSQTSSSTFSSNSSFTTPTNSTNTSTSFSSSSVFHEPQLEPVPEHLPNSTSETSNNPTTMSSIPASQPSSPVKSLSKTTTTTNTTSSSSSSPSTDLPPRAFKKAHPPPVGPKTPTKLPESALQLKLPSDFPHSVFTSNHDDVSTITQPHIGANFKPTAVLGFSKKLKSLKQHQTPNKAEIKSIGDSTTTIVLPTPPPNKSEASPTTTNSTKSIDDSTFPPTPDFLIKVKRAHPANSSSSIQTIGTSTDSALSSTRKPSPCKENNKIRLEKLLTEYRLKRCTTTDSSSYAPTNKTLDSINPTPTPRKSTTPNHSFNYNPRRSLRIAKIHEKYSEQVNSISSHLSTLSNEKKLSIISRFSPKSASPNIEAGSHINSASNPTLEEGEINNE